MLFGLMYRSRSGSIREPRKRCSMFETVTVHEGTDQLDVLLSSSSLLLAAQRETSRGLSEALMYCSKAKRVAGVQVNVL